MGRDKKMKFEIKAIGIIHTPYKDKKEIPCQGYKSDKVGEVEVFSEFEEALKDIEGFSHIYLIYYFHETTGFKPFTKTFLDEQKHGVFATRHYNRPNPIGISVVEFIKREESVLKVRQVDMLDKTPLLDIKPYVPQFDQRMNVKIGWLEDKIDKRNPNLRLRIEYFFLGLRDKFGIPFKPEKELNKFNIKEGQKILDYGCGIGSYTLPSANLVGEEGKVYALDKQLLAIKRIEERAKKEAFCNIDTILSDKHTGLPDRSIDVVLLYGVLPEIEDKEPLIRELYRVLKPNGYLSTRFCFRIKKNEILEIMERTNLFSLREQRGHILNFWKKKAMN